MNIINPYKNKIGRVIMSGAKYSNVSISDREYRRLINNSRELENIETRVAIEIQITEYNFIRNLEEQNRRIQSRIDRQNSVINSLNSEMKNIEQRLDNKIDAVNYKIDRLSSLIEQKEQTKRGIAQSWLTNTQDLFKIIETYEHNKFATGEFEKLQNEYVQFCQSNFNQENYEATIATTQSLWQKASELRISLEIQTNEWNEYLKEALKSNNHLIAYCKAQELVKLSFEMEDGNKELELDIDFWTNGKLNKLKELANSDKQKLENSQNLKTQDLKDLIKSSEEIKNEVIGLTEEAKEAIVLSQQRSEMAGDIYEALNEKGFNLEEHCFEEDDERKSIHLKMKNISDDEIVTIITPIGNKENKLDIHFFGDSSEDFKQVQLKNIFTSLKEANIEFTPPKCVEGLENKQEGNHNVRDFSKLQKTKKSSN